jgi:shikimate kinase
MRYNKLRIADLPLPNQVTLLRTVVMVGMMGSGKTAVGTALAHDLGVPFRDSDQEIEAAANATIAEIFTRFGEPFFREKESQVIERLLNGSPSILSAGGGAFLSAANRGMISGKGISVCLRADENLLWKRVQHRTTRPLLMTENPRATLSEICAKRAPIYALADVIVDTAEGNTVAQTADAVKQALWDAGALTENING